MATQILICDDSRFACKQLARSLPKHWDAAIRFAGNGEEALAIIRAGQAELLFLDLNMPVMDGYRVLEIIRKEDLPTLVIVVSGDVQPEAQARVRKLGALAFIKKPVDPRLVQTLLSEYGIEIEHSAGRSEPDIDISQGDCYQEIANVAMGRAADLLARVLGAFVRLPVPRVSMATIPELRQLLAKVDREAGVIAANQGFIGAGIAGEAFLLLDPSDLPDIAELLKYRAALTAQAELELLMDLSGILIAACLNGIAHQLDISFSQGPPTVWRRGDRLGERVELNVSHWEKVLTVEIEYLIETKDIRCTLVLLFTEDSLPALDERVSYISL